MDPITQPPELDTLKTTVDKYGVWYEFKEGTDRYPEKGPYTTVNNEQGAIDFCANWNEERSEEEYRLIPVRIVTTVERI